MTTGECSIMVTGEYILEIYKWYMDNGFVVNRRYQRKLVWTLEEKQKFINTILHGYPVPLFLLVNLDEMMEEAKCPRKEIIDGLQRLEAIISFILNKYPVVIDGEEQYFDLEVIPGTRELIKQDKLHQQYPTMSYELCRKFYLYQLPISTINANETVVDEVFKRINSTGRKLSSQDLRQAGITSRFSELVRLVATHLRGDATDDLIDMSEIADYSLSSVGLNYGLDVNTVFWIEQGIISEEALRRSKDEEIIATLCGCILSGNTIGVSAGVLNRLYDTRSSIYSQNEDALTEDRFDELIALFQDIISDMLKVFGVRNSNFSQLLFKSRKSYNKDLVFIILFLALTQLRAGHYQVEDYSEFGNVLEGIADRELSEIICSAECEWNKEIRNRLVERVKNVLVKCMVFREYDYEWNKEFLKLIKQAKVESQMFDFKIGFYDLRTGQLNEKMLSKCVKTLVAMANTNPVREGVVVLGISDKESDSLDFMEHYGTTVPKYNDYYVTGVEDEAVKYFGSVDKYLEFIKNYIEKEKIPSMSIYYILTTMDVLRYENKTLVVLKLAANRPLFYDKVLYVRYNSHNKDVEAGSEEYYAVMDNFHARLGAINAFT